jgi:tRNA threonylcarbamoyladenosine biosynthesis protein TsaE
MLERTTRSEAETMDLASSLAPCLRGGTLITLAGPLGAGKTAFVRGLARGLGINPADVSSPTFIICHEYEPPDPQRPRIAHLDLYRLGGADDLDTIGWDDLLISANTVIAIEWPERIADSLARLDRVSVTMQHEGESRRRVTINASPGLRSTLEPCVKRIAAAERALRCTNCGREVAPQAPTVPFCCERCRLVDLGRWFGGAYTISRHLEPDEDSDQ